MANRSCKNSGGFKVASVRRWWSLCTEGCMTCSWSLVSCWVRSARVLGPCLGPFSSKPCTDFSLAVPLLCRSTRPHLPLSMALLVQQEHISQPWIEASACLSSKSFMFVWLALDKTSVRVQNFSHLIFWSLSFYVGVLLLRFIFFCSNIFNIWSQCLGF